jgi:hypothetical protein
MKLIRTSTVYVWPKDQEDGEDYTYELISEEDYTELCKEDGVESLEGLSSKYGDAGEIPASEDSYSSSGYNTDVFNIPKAKEDEIKRMIKKYEKSSEFLENLFGK